MSSSEKSPIQKFYNNAGVFITGASGFLGTALLEKIIRSCPDIKRIYIMMRTKRNKSVEQRLEEIFDDHIWDKVREQNPNFKNYVKIIDGELMSPKLGISEENYFELKNEVNVIFHVAATVRFDEPIKKAAKINIEGTKNVLELAKMCKYLKAVVHVSTAYSHCVSFTLKEAFYEPRRDPEEFLAYCEKYSEEELNEQTPSIIGNYQNTYIFTKSLAENMVKKYENKLPIGLFRPSIVCGCAKEPIKGWAKGFFGPVGTMVGIGMGLIHVLPCNLDANIDLIPVDMCVNQMIAVAYETSKNQKKATIYNCVSGADNPISWREYLHWTLSFAHAYASIQSMWYYFLFTSSNKLLLLLYQFLFHLIPGYIVDACLRLTGNKPKLVKIYEKVHKFGVLHYYFSTKSWVFNSELTRQLYKNLDPKDKSIFLFDVKQIHWDKYLFNIVLYIRNYTVKEPISNVLAAQKKYFRFKVAHYSLLFSFLALFLWLLFLFFKLLM